MSDIPPFARALLERRGQSGSSSLDKTPQRTPVREAPQLRKSRKKKEEFNFEEEDIGEQPKIAYKRIKQREPEIRRRKYEHDFDEKETDENDLKQKIIELKRKNRALKIKVQMLQRELIMAQTKDNDSDPDLSAENEELRAQLKDERVKNRLAQENIKSLENTLKTKDRIIETKDLMIKRLQISCQEQANEYAKVAEQLKIQVSNFVPVQRNMSFNDPSFGGDFGSKSFVVGADPMLDPVMPPRDVFRDNDMFDAGFDDPVPPMRAPPGRNDDFMDAFEEQPIRHYRKSGGFNEKDFDDFNDNRGAPPFNDMPIRRDGPPFDEPLPRPIPTNPPKKDNIPEGFRGGDYSEDMPIRPGGNVGFGSPPPPMDYPPQSRFNDYESVQDNAQNVKESIEDIRKKIDKLMPRKQELERKLNIAIPKGRDTAQVQRERESYDKELMRIKKQISSYKLQIKKMGK
jgi:hypothetical protein